jgi:hypothetical protein
MFRLLVDDDCEDSIPRRVDVRKRQQKHTVRYSDVLSEGGSLRLQNLYSSVRFRSPPPTLSSVKS